jgi:hypothetical protein
MRFANHGHESTKSKGNGLLVSDFGQIQNVTPKIFFDGTSNSAQFYATRDIFPHEEIFFDYHYEIEL